MYSESVAAATISASSLLSVLVIAARARALNPLPARAGKVHLRDKLLDDMALLVDLDRHDGLVAGFVIVFRNTGSKRVRQILYAGGENIVEATG